MATVEERRGPRTKRRRLVLGAEGGALLDDNSRQTKEELKWSEMEIPQRTVFINVACSELCQKHGREKVRTTRPEKMQKVSRKRRV